MNSRGAPRPALARLWLTVLDQPPGTAIAEDANFYTLGGTSMQVIMLHTLLEERLGITVDIVELFDLLATQGFGEWADQILEPASSADA